jgi:hypothetical protein
MTLLLTHSIEQVRAINVYLEAEWGQSNWPLAGGPRERTKDTSEALRKNHKLLVLIEHNLREQKLY